MFCFIHIEKAAGTTLHTIFLNNYWSYVQIQPRLYWTNREENALLPEEICSLKKILKFSQGFGGHTVRSYLGYEKILERKIDYITFLREPVKIYISHYNYQKNVMKVDWSVDNFLAEESFSNFMTKRIAGGYDLKKAKEILTKHFSFVGLTEFFDQSLLIMKYRLFSEDFDMFYQKRNVARSYYSENFSKERIQQIKKNNRLDIELYAYVKDILYKRYLDEYPGNLFKDIEDFKKSKAEYSYKKNIIHRFLSRGYDILFHYLQGNIHRKYHG
ncbi:MAG: hypothetical protein D3904_06430 [Candidatus Electrothrix sp. EH2]|nr:hypothetical protein [Candidatus Electrothrix sp. EH2]